ncbi:MAG: Lrp/AsnC family transcriptional regulator [Chloroflexi bacterium]|nr:Lrp/AsnC family transcriptional regulator [Chloroflexota bacterium]
MKHQVNSAPKLEEGDKIILNHIQGGFPITSRPFKEIGEKLGMSETEVIERIKNLCLSGALSRFGPVLNPRRMGGNSTLAAMSVSPDRLEQVIALVNSYPEVSHNYERQHRFNLWFVVSAESEAEIKRVLAEIEAKSSFAVMNLPMMEEYFVGVNFQFEVE